MATMAVLLLIRLPSLRKGALWFLHTPHRTAPEWVRPVHFLLLKEVLRSRREELLTIVILHRKRCSGFKAEENLV